MWKNRMNRAATLAVMTGALLTAGAAQAGAASATASILNLDGGALLSFVNDQFLSDASTPFQSGFEASSTLQNYTFSTTAPNGDTSFAGIDNSFLPYPQTAAGAVNNGRGAATVLWSFDWLATGTGTATVDLDYLYSATLQNLAAGETGIASSFVSLLRDGTSQQQEALNYFSNQDGNTAGENHLLLNFDVNAGDTGSITVAVASTALIAPVPVPGAVWLLGSALSALLGIARRKAAYFFSSSHFMPGLAPGFFYERFHGRCD